MFLRHKFAKKEKMLLAVGAEGDDGAASEHNGTRTGPSFFLFLTHSFNKLRDHCALNYTRAQPDTTELLFEIFHLKHTHL